MCVSPAFWVHVATLTPINATPPMSLHPVELSPEPVGCHLLKDTLIMHPYFDLEG